MDRIEQCSITLTRSCNLRCKFCYAKRTNYLVKDVIDYESLKELIDFCKEANVKYLLLTGGEPLLYPQIKDILKYIQEMQYSFQIAIPTNGTKLNDLDLCKELINHGVSYFDISLKGKDNNEFREMTQFDYFLQQKEAIHNLSCLPIDFTCSMVLTQENIMSFCDTIQNAKNCGGKQFSFTFEIDNNLSEDNSLAYLEKHNPFELIDCFFSQLDTLYSITDDWWIEYSFPMCFYTEAQLKLLKKRLASICNVHTETGISFDTDLNVLLCDMFLEHKMGQFKKDFLSFTEFIQHTKNSVFQKTQAAIKKLPSNQCLSCKYLSSCNGGCPIIWKNYTFEDAQKFASSDRIISNLS